MPKPTREELLSPPRYDIYTDDFDCIVHKHLEKGDWVAWEHVEPLKQSYLAQEEELNDLVNTLLERDRENLAIQAENQALKASMEAEYIERQAKHIQELVEENMALKTKLLKLEA